MGVVGVLMGDGWTGYDMVGVFEGKGGTRVLKETLTV